MTLLLAIVGALAKAVILLGIGWVIVLLASYLLGPGEEPW